MLGQLLDRIAAVSQNSAIAIDIGDGALAGGRVQKRRIVRHDAEIFSIRS